MSASHYEIIAISVDMSDYRNDTNVRYYMNDCNTVFDFLDCDIY